MARTFGKIVARPQVARACGCIQEFKEYEKDQYRAQRLTKFQRTRCAACAARLLEEQRRVAEALPKKGEALQALPPGTQIALTRKPDGTWAGSLSAGGTSAEATGDTPLGLTVTLARVWLALHSTGSRPNPNPG
jgi:hypothetical protein